MLSIKTSLFYRAKLNSVTNYEANTARNEINVGFVSFSVCGELWFHEGDRWRVTLTDASVCLYVQIEMGYVRLFMYLCVCVYVFDCSFVLLCSLRLLGICVCLRLLEYARVLTHSCVYLSKKV